MENFIWTIMVIVYVKMGFSLKIKSVKKYVEMV
jgi:hypothetical protein